MQGEENITMQEMIDKFVIEKGRVSQDMIAEIVRMTNLESRNDRATEMNLKEQTSRVNTEVRFPFGLFTFPGRLFSRYLRIL